MKHLAQRLREVNALDTGAVTGHYVRGPPEVIFGLIPNGREV